MGQRALDQTHFHQLTAIPATTGWLTLTGESHPTKRKESDMGTLMLDPNEEEAGALKNGRYEAELARLCIRKQTDEKGGRNYLTAYITFPEEPLGEDINHWVCFMDMDENGNWIPAAKLDGDETPSEAAKKVKNVRDKKLKPLLRCFDVAFNLSFDESENPRCVEAEGGHGTVILGQEEYEGVMRNRITSFVTPSIKV
jgi:hypothetical protein